MYAAGEMQKNDYKAMETLINNDDDSKRLSRILIEKSPIHTISATDFIADCEGKSFKRRISKVGKNTLHAFQDAAFKISAAFSSLPLVMPMPSLVPQRLLLHLMLQVLLLLVLMLMFEHPIVVQFYPHLHLTNRLSLVWFLRCCYC